MINKNLQRILSVSALALALSGTVVAQSSRPRRVKPAPKPAEEPLLRPEPRTTTTARTDPNAPLINVQPVRPVANPVASGDTANAYQLLQQKQFAAAAKEAKAVAANSPNDAEAWTIPGSPS